MLSIVSSLGTSMAAVVFTYAGSAKLTGMDTEACKGATQSTWPLSGAHQQWQQPRH